MLNIPKVVGELTGSTARRKIKEMKAHAESITLDKSVTRKEQAKYYNVGTGKITVKESTVPVPAKYKSKKKAAQTPEPLAGEQYDQESRARKPQFDNEDRRVPAAEQNRPVKDGQQLEDITEVLGAGRFADTESETAVLSADNGNGAGYDGYSTLAGDDSATDVLSTGYADGDSATEVLSADGDSATEVLSADGDSATEVLSSKEEPATEVLSFGDTVSDEKRPRFKTESESVYSGKADRPGFTVLMDVMLVHTQDSI